MPLDEIATLSGAPAVMCVRVAWHCQFRVILELDAEYLAGTLTDFGCADGLPAIVLPGFCLAFDELPYCFSNDSHVSPFAFFWHFAVLQHQSKQHGGLFGCADLSVGLASPFG